MIERVSICVGTEEFGRLASTAEEGPIPVGKTHRPTSDSSLRHAKRNDVVWWDETNLDVLQLWW